MTATSVEPLEGTHSVLGRTFELLECFAHGSGEQSIAGLCRATGLPASTVHRLLANLVEWGAVERTSRGRYCLGRLLWRLGVDVPSSRSLKDAARPCLVDLHTATRGVAVLATPDADGVLVADVVAGRSALGQWSPPRLLPYPDSAPGLLCLAHRPGPAMPGQDDFRTRQHLAVVRRDGIAVHEAGGMTWVSAPVFDARSSLRSTVSAVVPSERLAPTAVARAVVRAARAITHDLVAPGLG